MGSEAGRYKKAPIGLQDSLDGGIDLLSTILHFAFDDSSGFLVKAKKFSDFKENHHGLAHDYWDHTSNSMAIGPGDLVHLGRLHSYPIGVGRHRHLGPCYSGPPPHPLDPQAWAAERVYLLRA
jgi:hypothetical protein